MAGITSTNVTYLADAIKAAVGTDWKNYIN